MINNPPILTAKRIFNSIKNSSFSLKVTTAIAATIVIILCSLTFYLIADNREDWELFSEVNLSISEARPILTEQGILIPKEFNYGKISKNYSSHGGNVGFYQGRIYSSVKVELIPKNFGVKPTVVEDCGELPKYLKNELPYCKGTDHPNLLILKVNEHGYVGVEVSYDGTTMYLRSDFR